MTQIIAVHSFRGGTGKSNLTANLATSLGLNGKRVAVLDTDLASPGIHVLFDFELDEDQKCLNDFLQEACPIKECVHEVTPDVMKALKGQIFLLPASLDSDRIARLLREGYQVEKLNDAIFAIADDMNLDFILIDTHPGINEETLLSAAIADHLVMVMRPDSQDYLGTAVAIEVAQRLDVMNIQLVMNKLPNQFSRDEVRLRMQESYEVSIGSILPLSEDLLTLASGGLAVLEYPNHSWTCGVRDLATVLLELSGD